MSAFTLATYFSEVTNRILLLGALLLVALLAMPSLATAAVTCSLVGEVSVRCVDEEERIVFVNSHAPQSAFYGAPLHAPFSVDGRHFYAHGHDLLEIDLQEQAVVARYRFPSQIESISPESDAVLVTLRNITGNEPVPARFRLDGTTPDRLIWRWDGTHNALGDARFAKTVLEVYESPDELPSAEALHRHFGTSAAMDHTNPFYYYFLARGLLRIGETEQAIAATHKAARTPGAHWSDLTRLWTMLKAIGAHEAAEHTWSRITEKLAATEFDPAEIHTMVFFGRAFFNSDRDPEYQDEWPVTFSGSIADALATDKDFPYAVGLLGPLAETFPYLEVGPHNYQLLATHFRSEGKTSLASYFEERVQIAQESPLLPFAPKGAGWRANWNLFFAIVSALALLLTCLLMGLRHGARRRREPQPGTFSWKPLLPELVVLLTLGFGLSLLANHLIYEAKIYNEVVSLTFSTSFCLGDGCLAKPTVLQGLQAFHPSPARDALLEFALEERAAIEQGRPVALPLPDVQTRYDALLSEARQVVERPLQLPSPVLVLIGILIYGIQWAIVFVLGYLLGARVPGVGWFATRFVPGGSQSLSVVAFVPVVLALGGVVGLSGFGQLYYNLGTEVHPAYFGLESLVATYHPAFFTSWFVLAIVVAIAIHAIGVLIDLRREAQT